MNNIKSVFSIKDLENLSGIKAHTIRIWEKRYNLLEPMRTETNIRLYDIFNLQKLLNVVLLTEYGYKISKVSKFNSTEISNLVLKIQNSKNIESHAYSEFKMAMMNFDQKLFDNTFEKLSESKSFIEIFKEIFIPLLEEIGILWTTNTITPAHEHFLSYLIKHKILSNIELETKNKTINQELTYVLFLPENEIHDLGLLFINYVLVKNGNHVIYLGRSIPINDITNLNIHFNKINFITYFTVAPEDEDINNYLNDFSNKILTNSNNKLLVFGRKTQKINPKIINEQLISYNNIQDFLVDL